jgi:hypothetical protein
LNEEQFPTRKTKRDNIINKYAQINESLIHTSIMDSKYILNETELKIWQNIYINKLKHIQQEFKEEIAPFMNDKNNIQIVFRPNCFDRETWYNLLDYTCLENKRTEFINLDCIVLT